MSEFKFSCPNCQQNIQATSEYSGLQINCPSCQTLLVVPAAPDAPAPAAAPSGSRLSMAPSTPHAQPSPGAGAAAAMYSAKPVRKKKPKTNLIVGLSLGAIAVAATIYFWPTLMKKFKHEEQLVSAADQAATNAPPPPPPPLTTEEILQNVSDAYKGMTDYAAKAKTDCNIDMSALVPGKRPMNLTTTSSLQLGRTNNYRLEWEQNAGGTKTKGAAWSSGKGNFIGYGAFPPSKVKTRQDALTPAADSFFLLSVGIAELFFADSNSVAAQAVNFTKTNGPSINGPPCYVLTGEADHVNVLLWVNKDNFLISQIEVALGGTIPEEELKKYNSTQRNQMIALSKLKGTITETYDNIQTNQTLLASAFEAPYQPAANPNAQRPQRASSMAGQLTNPGKRRQQGQ
jgi:hypothetical protein